jgi:hypothetical protein
MIFEEEKDTKREIITIVLNQKKQSTQKEVLAIRFREVANTIETCTFFDSEFFSYFENLLLQWGNFQTCPEEVHQTWNLVYNVNQNDQSKIEKILVTSSSTWKYFFDVNFLKHSTKVSIKGAID